MSENEIIRLNATAVGGPDWGRVVDFGARRRGSGRPGLPQSRRPGRRPRGDQDLRGTVPGFVAGQDGYMVVVPVGRRFGGLIFDTDDSIRTLGGAI